SRDQLTAEVVKLERKVLSRLAARAHSRVVIRDLQIFWRMDKSQSPLNQGLRGDADAYQEDTARTLLFACITHLSASLRPVNGKFLRYRYGQDGIRGIGCDAKGYRP